MKLTLKIWRQTGRTDKGKFVSYPVNDVNPEMSMLECLDVLNETLIERGEEPGIEPWRAAAFPAIKDLVVDRRSFDRIIAAGGYISVSTGNAPDGNAILVSKETSDRSMDAAACIGCGACVAACPNASSALFTGAKIAHLSILPQGIPERDRRARHMVAQMNAEGFGGCTNIGECTAACPKEIQLEVIAKMNRYYLHGSWKHRDQEVWTVKPMTG